MKTKKISENQIGKIVKQLILIEMEVDEDDLNVARTLVEWKDQKAIDFIKMKNITLDELVNNESYLIEFSKYVSRREHQDYKSHLDRTGI